RVGNRALPIGIEGVDEFVAVSRGEDQIFTGGLVLLQAVEDGLLLVGPVQSDGDEFEIAMAIHAINRDELVELSEARRAPGSPEIDQPEFAGIILAKGF